MTPSSEQTELENAVARLRHECGADGDAYYRDIMLVTSSAKSSLDLQRKLEELQVRFDKRFNKPNLDEFGFPELLKMADAIVKNYPLYKRFIRGTPLDNDCAVWMAEFARNQLALASIPTTVEEVEREEWSQERNQLLSDKKALEEEVKELKTSLDGVGKAIGLIFTDLKDWHKGMPLLVATTMINNRAEYSELEKELSQLKASSIPREVAERMYEALNELLTNESCIDRQIYRAQTITGYSFQVNSSMHQQVKEALAIAQQHNLGK